MADIEITDEASLEAWLKTRPRRDAEIIAFRAAARVFPLWGRAMEEEWAKQHNFSSLPSLRSLIIIDSSNVLMGQEFYKMAEIALIELDSVANLAKEKTHVLDYSGAKALVQIVQICGVSAKTSSSQLDYSSVIARIANMHKVANYVDYFSRKLDNGELWLAISADSNTLYTGADHSRLPLWPTPAPDWFTTADRETRAIWAKDPATWAFWEKWWDGVISGDMPFPPELLRDVALIEDDIWQAGPKAVAQAIAKIEKIHELRAQLAALTQAMEDEDLSQVQQGATLAHRGHNNPPEMIEAIAIVQASAVEIARSLDAAREELAKPAPEPSRLKAIGTWMQSALMKAARYCGVLTDKFLQEFAGEMGKQAATVVAWLIKGGIGVSMLTAFAKSMIAIWPS